MPTVDDIASAIANGHRQERVLVAIDGGDGSGKTTYATNLAVALGRLNRTALVIHADDFMHPSAVRHRRGRTSPEGYLDDSYDYEALTRSVLEPLSIGGNGEYRMACIDRSREVRINPPVEHAAPSTITIVEGLFLLREELARWWDYSIFLEVSTSVAMARKSRRDAVVLQPDAELTRRYVEGQRIYQELHRPRERATWTLGNEA
ncbi:uridine kinase [Nocardioides sp. LMS-CY]|uniref:uridine kinase n=1 Tax=Nocardioides sp. (strain LMS-CY) TaxID=2840457 RepID=UPI001C001C25|nr:uridine kinase [Nocardioides sp. LMS-CY]QWF21205.1 uridine kinase [Nocardioides sp. LMS-CY]